MSTKYMHQHKHARGKTTCLSEAAHPSSCLDVCAVLVRAVVGRGVVLQTLC